MIQHPMLRRLNMFAVKRARHAPNLLLLLYSASVSSSKRTVALISRYSARRRGSSGARRRSLDRADMHSSSRCFIMSQRGEKGRKNIPKKRIQAGMSWSARGRRHEMLFSPRQVVLWASVQSKVPSGKYPLFGKPAGSQFDPPTKCIP